MPYNSDVIDFLQKNDILAEKLDLAFTGMSELVSNQIETIGAGVQRALYYASCFTDEYQDVCKKQKNEDIRFAKSVYRPFQNNEIVYEILKIYFHEILRQKTSEQLESIKQTLMRVNIHIAASSLTKAGFILATASLVSVSMSMSLNISTIIGRTAGNVVTVAGVYGVVQKAAESAERLRIGYPAFFTALYSQELEMFYFLVEPAFSRAQAFKGQWASDSVIANIIENFIG